MSPVAKIRKLLWGCSCLACHFLNVVLAIFAVGQGGLLALNFLQHEVPLPDRLTEWVINSLGPDNLEADWEDAVFDLRAGLLLSGFQLRNSSTEQIIATAREAHLQWSPLHLFISRLAPIHSVEARDVEIYIPVSHSPTGLNEPVLAIRHVAMREDNGELRVGSLIVESGKVRLYLEGTAPLHAFSLKSEGGGGTRFYDLLQQIRRLPPDLEAMAEISWRLFPSGSHLFQLRALVPNLEYDIGRMSSLSMRARMRLARDGLSILDLHMGGSLSLTREVPKLPLIDEVLNQEPIPFELSAGGALRKTGNIQVPSSIRLNLHPRDESLPVRHLLLRTAYWGSISPVHWIASSSRAFSEGWAYPVFNRIEDITGFPFKLDFRGYLPECLLADLVPGLPDVRMLEGAGADQIQLNATFDPLSLTLEGMVATDGLYIGQTNFARLHTRLSLNRQHLRLEDMQVRQSDNQYAYGSYIHEFSTSKFSLNAMGSTFPETLDILLGRWWQNIFKHIEANEPLPADVTVWGQWRDLKSLQSITTVDGNNGSYRGVHIPRLQLRVRSNHQWAVLETLKASFPDGSFGGRIAIRSGLKQDDIFRAMLLDLESDAPWEALCAASGIEELCEATFVGNPHVTVRGVLWQDSGKGFRAIPQADLRLGLSQPTGSSVVQDLQLEGLSLSGRLKGSTLDLTGLSGRFAEGVFTGNIRIDNWQSKENRHRHYNLQLVDAHFGSARKQLSESFGYDPKVSTTLPTQLHEGRVDALLNLTTGASLEAAHGFGSVGLRQAKLGQIHLFGGLSRFFTSMGFKFSSLNLDALTFDWLLADSVLRINNGYVTGPSLRLQIAGALDLAAQQLAMQAEVTLVKGMMGMVLSPVSENLFFDLEGPIEDPQWTISFSPFKRIQEPSLKEGPPIEL
ncbi:MAG: AsmA-like C-terminal region-containing protein [Puniceicoccaceae bacterium]